MATTTSPSSASGNEVNELLNQTEVGSFIAKNKTAVLVLIAVVIVGVFAYGYYRHANGVKRDAYANELYTYTTKSLEDFKGDKLKAQDLVNGFKAVYSGKEGFSSAGIFMIQLTDELMAKGNNDEAYALLKLGIETISNQQMLFFLRTRAAVVAENIGQDKEALSHLENIIKGNVMYLGDKVYLDAGRLYHKLGDKEKALSSLNWVIDQGTEEEFKKMAKLYLETIGA